MFSLFQRINRPERDTDHSPPSRAETVSLALFPLLLYASMMWCLDVGATLIFTDVKRVYLPTNIHFCWDRCTGIMP
jgi:hypothetical protein